MINGVPNPGDSSAESNPSPFHGWQISLSNSKGPFGPETIVAVAEKAGAKISASAWRSDIVVEMIHSMIRLRENVSSSKADAPREQQNPDAAPSPRPEV